MMTIRLPNVVKQVPGASRVFRALFPPKPGSLGLTTIAEREYFSRTAASEFRGRGAILDLGSWLGSTTAALAQGLLRNPLPMARNATIQTYDLFRWDSAYDPFTPPGFRFSNGECFLTAFKANVKPWLGQINIHEGDLTAKEWQGQVELILDDAAKAWTVAQAIWEKFVVNLLPGGLLIEQDFKHYYCPWLHLVHYRFRDRFELAEDVRDGATTAFRLLRPVALTELAGVFNAAAYSTSDIRASFDWAAALVYPEWRPAIYAAEAMHFVHMGKIDTAREVLSRMSDEQRGGI